MKVVMVGDPDGVSRVYVSELRPGKWVEFADAVSRPQPREEKWVLLVSTLFGCPVGCTMCDAGFYYGGKLTPDEILGQIDFLVRRHFVPPHVPVEKFKVQFARMGDPALNPAVLEALDALPQRYRAPGLMPSISTIAPRGCDGFMERLAVVKDRHYGDGRFQLQFSVHTTDDRLRRGIIPVPTWDFDRMAHYGKMFLRPGDRKITLNFALIRGMPVDADRLLRHFDPRSFLLKLTPINPTYRAAEAGLVTHLPASGDGSDDAVVRGLRRAGFEVIASIGDEEENRVGSNCGQSLLNHLGQKRPIRSGYTGETPAAAGSISGR